MESAPAILIVDDSADDIGLTKVLFQKAGGRNEIVAMHDGDATIEHLSGIADQGALALPLALLLDMKVPGFSGLELLEWVREHHAFDRMAVVVLSGTDKPDEIARAASLGAQGYFGKFPGVAALQAVISAAHAFRTGSNQRLFDVPGNLLLERGGLPAFKPD